MKGMRQDSEHNQVGAGMGAPCCLVDLSYAACNTMHTAPHRSVVQGL